MERKVNAFPLPAGGYHRDRFLPSWVGYAWSLSTQIKSQLGALWEARAEGAAAAVWGHRPISSGGGRGTSMGN